jgi:hypothetical protein
MEESASSTTSAVTILDVLDKVLWEVNPCSAMT